MAKKYTAAQKRAYWTGQGYAACNAGKRVPCSSAQTEASFKAGYNKGRQKAAKYPNKGGNR